jgi:hypothetical protein
MHADDTCRDGICQLPSQLPWTLVPVDGNRLVPLRGTSYRLPSDLTVPAAADQVPSPACPGCGSTAVLHRGGPSRQCADCRWRFEVTSTGVTIPRCCGCNSPELEHRLADRWECLSCGYQNIVRDDGSTRPWLQWTTAGRRQRRRKR